MKPTYLSVAYDPQEKPFTKYPLHLAGYLVRRFGLKGTLLDTGCGRMEMMDAFSRHNLFCYGCDREVPKSGWPETKVKEFDLTGPFPYPDACFDIVFSKSVLEHISDSASYLSEVYRILVPGGIFIVLTPDWKALYREFYEEPDHVHPYTVQAVRSLLRLAVFRDVGSEAFCHHELAWTWQGKALAWVMRRLYPVSVGRWLTRTTGVKFFRWAVERNVLAWGKK